MKYMNIAIRNLSREKKRSILLGSAIAFGILMITIVNAFTAGATRNVKEGISQLLAGHIYVSEQTKRADGEVIESFEDEEPVIEQLGILGYGEEAFVRRSALGARILFNGREASQQIQGVVWDQEESLQKRINLAEGSVEAAIADPRGIIISGNVAKLLKVEVGEEVTVRGSTVTGQENVGTFVVHGIMVESSFFGSVASYSNRARVNSMLNLPPDSYQNLHVSLPAIELTDEVTNQLYDLLSVDSALAPREEAGGIQDFLSGVTFQDDEDEDIWEGSRYDINNINDFTSIIDQLSVTLNGVGLAILVILIVITMVGVSNTFRMIMFERVKEIGTMRAVGVRRGGVRRIFLWEAFGLGTLGYVLGIVLALLVTLMFQLITVPADNPFNIFTFNGKLTFPLSVASLVLNYVLMVGFTIISANIPASKAAKLPPADALRA